MDKTSVKRKMGIAALIMMSSVFLSRILGYARDAVIAYTQGANAGTDAYFAAFTVPDFLNYLLAGASLSITFIPIYTSYLSRGEVEEGNRAFSSIFCVLSTVMIVLVIIGELFADKLIPLIAPGFQGGQLALTARLMRIVMPAQLFFYGGGLLMAVQYSREKFFIPALAPLVYNAGIIAGGLLLGKKMGMEGFAWGVLAGSFVGNFLIQMVGAYGSGLRIKPLFDLRHPGFREFVRLSIPIMLGFSLVFVDEWMTRIFGSFLVAGAITWLNNARRLAQVPIGVFGQASGVASYPFLAEQAANNRIWDMFRSMSTALDWVFYYSSFAAAVTFILSREIVLTVFKRGAFGMNDTVNTASALSLFALGIPFWCSQNIIARGFFAVKDTIAPTIIGSLAWLLTLPAYYFLMVKYGVVGLAAASSAGIILHTTALYIYLLRKLNLGFKAKWLKVQGISLAIFLIATAASRELILRFAVSLPSWEDLGGSLVRLGLGAAIVSIIFLVLGLAAGLEPARSVIDRLTGRSSKVEGQKT